MQVFCQLNIKHPPFSFVKFHQRQKIKEFEKIEVV